MCPIKEEAEARCFCSSLFLALTVVIFQDNEYHPRIAPIGSFQTNTSVLAPTVKKHIGPAIRKHAHKYTQQTNEQSQIGHIHKPTCTRDAHLRDLIYTVCLTHHNRFS